MSRGHGAVQRWVLDLLHANPYDPLRDEHDAADHEALPDHGGSRLAVGGQRSWTRLVDMVGADASASRIESVRQSLDKLCREGLVQLVYVERQIPGRSWTGSVTRNYLAARLTPLPAVQQEIDAVREQKHAEWQARCAANKSTRAATRTFTIPKALA